MFGDQLYAAVNAGWGGGQIVDEYNYNGGIVLLMKKLLGSESDEEINSSRE